MNFPLNIDGLDVEIIKLDIQQFGNNSTKVPGNQSIKMIGLVANKDYMKLEGWFNGVLGRNYLPSYLPSSPATYKKI